MEWGGAGDTDVEARAKRGCWVALRDLARLKAWLPLNSGLFGIQLQGQLWGRGEAVDGEVTRMGVG